MKTYFTFGADHLDVSGHSLYRTVVVVDDVSENEARHQMFNIRGSLWAFSYPDIPQCRDTIEKLVGGNYEVINLKHQSTIARLKVMH